MIVPAPMQCLAWKNTITRITAFINNCHVPKLQPINPLIPRFIALKGSTPNPDKRRKDTHRPINKIPKTSSQPCLLFSLFFFPHTPFSHFNIYILDSKSVHGTASPGTSPAVTSEVISPKFISSSP